LDRSISPKARSAGTRKLARFSGGAHLRSTASPEQVEWLLSHPSFGRSRCCEWIRCGIRCGRTLASRRC